MKKTMNLKKKTITVYRFCLDRESDYLFAFDAISLFQMYFFFWRNEIISKNTNAPNRK